MDHGRQRIGVSHSQRLKRTTQSSCANFRALRNPYRLRELHVCLTSDDILYSGMEVLPIGGYTGLFPSPTVKMLARLVSTGQVRVFLIPVVPKIDDPRVAWIRSSCRRVESIYPLAREFSSLRLSVQRLRTERP